MIQIKTTKDSIIRKCEVSKEGTDVRITVIKRPERMEGAGDAIVLSIAISKETFIQEMKKFLKEVEG